MTATRNKRRLNPALRLRGLLGTAKTSASSDPLATPGTSGTSGKSGTPGTPDASGTISAVGTAGILLGVMIASAACSEATDSVDGGMQDGSTCPTILPQAETYCRDSSCNATTGTKTFAQADLDSARSSNWIVATWASSEILDNQELNVAYGKEATGGLSPRTRSIRQIPDIPSELLATVYSEGRLRRIENERLIRSWQRHEDGVDIGSLRGTGIRSAVHRSDDVSARDQIRADTTCSISAPSCGATALCVIPEGNTEGTCASTLSLKFPTSGSTFEPVQATVRRVGELVAIAVDDADTMSDADIQELVRRFDTHLGPIAHTLFGMPKNAQGRDRDGNGVVLFFVTSRLASLGAGGESGIVGIFQPNDLGDPNRIPTSNGADLLYVQPTGPNVSLDNLSGTIIHEYQHLINFYAKNVLRGVTSGEEVWLDEGLSTFLEEIAGYGADSYANVAAYLGAVGNTSLTGAGLGSGDPDSNERRGMAHLFVRYFFEENGGADFPEMAGAVVDKGGVAAVRALVQNEETGLELFDERTRGRSWDDWIGDLMTTVAVDGASIPGVSCNPKYSFDKPTDVALTGYRRGIDLRKDVPNFEGALIPLRGPGTSTFESEEIPLPINSGEIKTVAVPRGTVKIRFGGPAEDVAGGLRAIPVP